MRGHGTGQWLHGKPCIARSVAPHDGGDVATCRRRSATLDRTPQSATGLCVGPRWLVEHAGEYTACDEYAKERST